MNDAENLLRQKYRASFSEKANDLHELIVDIAANNAAIRAYMHRLAGSAGMYGFDELHRCARESEISPDNSLLEQTLGVIQLLEMHAEKQ